MLFALNLLNLEMGRKRSLSEAEQGKIMAFKMPDLIFKMPDLI
jgi:hypothetical protein